MPPVATVLEGEYPPRAVISMYWIPSRTLTFAEGLESVTVPVGFQTCVSVSGFGPDAIAKIIAMIPTIPIAKRAFILLMGERLNIDNRRYPSESRETREKPENSESDDYDSRGFEKQWSVAGIRKRRRAERESREHGQGTKSKRSHDEHARQE